MKILKTKKKLEKFKQLKLPLLAEIQYNMNQIYEKIISSLKGKTGFFRGTLLGNRINFSVRTIISPLPNGKGYQINDVLYPYVAAVEVFKFEIINILSKKYSYLEAYRIWKIASSRFSKEVYNILNELVTKTKGGLSILINRNPTIDLGSMLNCRIKKVKEDYYDMTMNVSNNILGLIAGDYDGDVLTSISLKDHSFRKFFRGLDPRQLVISKDTGKFNEVMNFDKDYKLGLSTFMN
jgi:hypothetical protein